MHKNWWHDAVVYQTYLRSFADADGDGIGDLAGLKAHLSHLSGLGVDALWLNPCYASPQKDHGYDIADYFTIDPAYGTVAELEELVAQAHSHGMRLLMDMVANHCSDQHVWFQKALKAEPGSAERDRFLFRDGRGENGQLPPNNWQSVFGGMAWTRVTDAGVPGQWYLHAFDSSQPDFNWRNADVADYFDEVLRFWFDRGVDGFRIDVAHGMVKAVELADWPGAEVEGGGHNYAMWDQPEVHDIYRRWRAIGDSYGPEGKYFVGEIWVPSVESLSAYLAADELHQAFSFDLLVQPWDAKRMTGAIRRSLAQGELTGGPPAWTLSNHDVHRTATRYGQSQDMSDPVPTDMIAAARRVGDVDLALGIRRARAAIMLQLALPGTTFLYQGEELGLPEVLDLPDNVRQDPIWLRSGGTVLGRDGCRVPLPWNTSNTTFGFSPTGATAEPWLPQPDSFRDFAAEEQRTQPDSTLALYTSLIAARRDIFSGNELTWLSSPPEVLAFQRGSGICVVNFGESGFAIPGDWGLQPAITSHDPALGDDHVLPANSAAWLVAARVSTDATTPEADRIFRDPPSPQLAPAVPLGPQSHMRSNDAPHFI